MTPLKIHLKGFIGINSSFGKKEITIDLESMAGDSELIAIVGPNGAGKSTLMDNLQPYRLMPSRASGLTPSTFSFWDHISGPEALKELEWHHNGARYKTSLIFKNSGKTKKAESYLHVQTDGQWHPVVLEDGTISDGKTDTYDRCVEGIMGSPETFFTCGFAAQKRAPISSYNNGEIKNLMTDLLGIEKIRLVGEKAARVVKGLKAGLENTRRSLESVVQTEATMAAMQNELSEAKAKDTSLQQQRASARQVLTDAQLNFATVKANQDSMASTETRRKNLVEILSKANTTLQEKVSTVNSDISRETLRLGKLETEHQQAMAQSKAQINTLNTTIQNKQSLLSRKQEIEQEVTNVLAFKAKEQPLQTELEASLAKQQKLNELTTQHSTLTATLEGIKRDGVNAADTLTGLKGRVILIEQVPCIGNSMQSRCPLLKDAKDAEETVPSQTEKVNTLRSSYALNNKQLEALQLQISEFGDVSEMVRLAKESVQDNAMQLRRSESIAAMADSLSDAEKTIETSLEQIKLLEGAAEKREPIFNQELEEVKNTIEGLKARIVTLQDEHAKSVAEVDSELQSLPSALDPFMLSDSEAALKIAGDEVTRIETAIAGNLGSIARLQATIDEAVKKVDAAQDSKNLAARIENEIAYWALLAKAFGNDGIVALSIDDAGPTLSSIVNDLLQSCYGSRFTMSIQTQTETAKGEVREGFDIVVHDAKTDESKSVTLMSGGEQVWINEAMARGIALYLAQNSGAQYETLFSDEADGPLDPERKKQFMRMKREVLRIGGYKREFFVSQHPDNWALADKQIDMTTF
jgi:exonuclease SbcC